jgi:sialidase-1
LKTAGIIGGASIAGHAWWRGTASAALLQDIEYVTVFERGETQAYHTFRTPAVVRATDGTLLAFSGAHVNDAQDWGHVEMVLKRSSDGGRTWGPLQVVWADPPHKVANHVPVVDRETGRIHLYLIRTAGHVVGEDIINGTVSPQDAPRPHVLYSDDHGATWSAPVEITAEVKRPDMRHFVGGPGHGIQLTKGPHAGRLLVQGNHSVRPGEDGKPPVVGAHVIYSDDHGKTWRMGAIDRHDDGRVHPNETTLVELPDGTVYFNTRDQRGTDPGHRAATTSSDGGASFDAPFQVVPDLETPIVHGSLFRLADRVVFSCPGHVSAREDLSIWSSTDGATSWRKSVRLYDGPSGYSDLVELPDDVLGVIYENGPRFSTEPSLTYHKRLTFARVPMSAFDQPIPAPKMTPDTSGHGNHAIVDGAPRLIEGKYGGAMRLAGDYAEAPLTASLAVGSGPFTVAIWFRTSERRLQRIVQAYNYEEFPQWYLELGPGQDDAPGSAVVRGQIRTGTASGRVQKQGSFADGRWHHLALVRNETETILYVDGTPTTGAAIPGSVSAGAICGIRIGARVDGINNPVNGGVDEMYLFARALTATQIKALVDRNAPATTGMRLHLPLGKIR